MRTRQHAIDPARAGLHASWRFHAAGDGAPKLGAAAFLVFGIGSVILIIGVLARAFQMPALVELGFDYQTALVGVACGLLGAFLKHHPKSPSAAISGFKSALVRTARALTPLTSALNIDEVRFVASQCEVGSHGLRAQLESSAQQDLPWAAIGSVIVRQLPVGPPWFGKLILDVVPAFGASVKTPIRILPTTHVHYIVPARRSAETVAERFRRLAAHIAKQSSQVLKDADSAAFVSEKKDPPRFMSMAQFQVYDRQYDRAKPRSK
jgi:hypothetical protein